MKELEDIAKKLCADGMTSSKLVGRLEGFAAVETETIMSNYKLNLDEGALLVTVIRNASSQRLRGSVSGRF